jgi:hypothetical protein
MARTGWKAARRSRAAPCWTGAQREFGEPLIVSRAPRPSPAYWGSVDGALFNLKYIKVPIVTL